MLTLWDLIEPIRRKLRPPPRERYPLREPKPLAGRPAPRPGPNRPERPQPDRADPAASKNTTRARKPRGQGPRPGTSPDSMQARYDAVVRLHLDEYKIRVRKWRSGMSGIAWYVTYHDGRIQRLIESPRPKGPMSIAVFLHEIGHHAIGFDVYKPRCLEEYHAWRWALGAMERHGLNITDAVRYRVHMSLWYAVQKARRRGIKQVPAELAPFLNKPPRPTAKSAHRAAARPAGGRSADANARTIAKPARSR